MASICSVGWRSPGTCHSVMDLLTLEKKPEFWGGLDKFATSVNQPWLIIEDLNETYLDEDRSNRGQSSSNAGHWLRNSLSSHNLIELKATGNKFTWSNKRQGLARILAKLDRALVNSHWYELFPFAKATNFTILAFDHSPVLVDTMGRNSTTKKPFRFLNFWTNIQSSNGVVRGVWNCDLHDSSMRTLQYKLNRTKQELKNWNCIVVGNIHVQTEQLKQQLTYLKNDTATADQLGEEQKAIQSKLSQLNDHEEQIWFQKSRKLWLNSGDKNTRYYHTVALTRRSRNSLEILKNDDGRWLTNRDDIGNHITAKYKALFTTSSPELSEELSELIQPVVIESKNDLLTKILEDVEIKEVIFAMNGDKSPSPDGYNAKFFQFYLEIVKHDVIGAIREFFITSKMPRSLNATFIALIPKNAQSTTIDHLRPISLCNVIYKAISKILANRLKPLLNSIISPYQTGFMLGRSIHNNAAIAHEFFHSMKKKGRKKSYCALKIDLSKVYDRIEWPYILCLMELLGFNER